MNSGREFANSSKSGLSKTHRNPSRLLKLDHLTDLGLELFPDENSTNDLKNETLESVLLNGETGNYSVSSPVEDSFSTFQDYVPHDMPLLSPSQEDTEFIEVFPVTNSILLGTGVNIDDRKKKNTVLLSTLDDTPGKVLAPRRKAIQSISDVPPNKKYKIRRLVRKPLSKEEVISKKNESTNYSASKKSEENGFSDISRGDNLLSNNYNDNTELDNKINDTLLDMLQEKTGINPLSPADYSRKKTEKECFKFITIFPSKSDGKIINIMVKGKSCRSKQPLTTTELRLVTRILNHENSNAMDHSNTKSYRNVYYDSESDTNIRYEVKFETGFDEALSSQIDANLKSKKNKCTGQERNITATEKEGYLLNSVARTRCGRISRPPRHVIRDYKRLKRLNEINNDVDEETENNSGYADYREDANSNNPSKSVEPQTQILYGPLEPNKRQFSSLSRCPNCDKIYLGYRRMAIHFQKYPEHKNEELLRQLLIRSRKKASEENSSSNNTAVNELSTNSDTTKASSSQTNGVPKKKGRLYRRFRMRGFRNGFHLKELLSSFKVEDIIEYAAPVVATVLNSWEYLLLRSQKMKKDEESFVISLLKEISVVLKQLRALSHRILKPCDENEGNLRNTFSVEDKDILQFVLGVTPGKYITSEDESWVKEYSNTQTELEKVNLKEEYAALCSSTVTSDEDANDILDSHSSENQRNDEINSFYHIVTPDTSTFNVDDLVNDIENDLVASSATSSTQPSDLNQGEHLSYVNGVNDSSRLFCDLKNNVLPSMHVSEVEQLNLKSTNDPSVEMTRLDYIPQSFSESHALNFDSLVNGANDDLMNAFPISLPMLSDNSTDSKEYGELLSSLKNMDNTEKSVESDLNNTIVNGSTKSNQIDLISSLKNLDDKTVMNDLGNGVSNNLSNSSQIHLLNDLSNINSPNKSNVSAEATISNNSLLESRQIDLLDSLKNIDGSQSVMIDLDGTMCDNLPNSKRTTDVVNGIDTFQPMPESSNGPCLIDFVSLDSTFT